MERYRLPGVIFVTCAVTLACASQAVEGLGASSSGATDSNSIPTTGGGQSATMGNSSGDVGAGIPCASFPKSRVYEAEEPYEDIVGSDIERFVGVRCIRGGVLFHQVATLTPLRSLELVEGQLGLFASPVPNLHDLENLRQVSKILHIDGLSEIETLSGLERLESVGGLFIGNERFPLQTEPIPERGNGNLRSLQGLEGLREIRNGGLTIGDNELLEDITSLTPQIRMDTQPVLGISIQLNPKLPVSQVQALEATLASNGSELTGIGHCGNLGDAPCESMPTD